MPRVQRHVMISPASDGQRAFGPLYAVNLSEDELRDRIIRPYDEGRPVTWGGRTLPAGDIARVTVVETKYPVDVAPAQEWDEIFKDAREAPGAYVRDVTNKWITGPPGVSAAATESAEPVKDGRTVMVVHGRNLRARDAMFEFLRALGLRPIEWEQAVAETGVGSPHNLDAVRAAMDAGQAVVVLLTAEDQAGLLPSLAVEEDDDVLLRGQPRQNVTLEAGLAMGVDASRTVLVEVGPIRLPSDFEGLNAVRLTNDVGPRGALRTRLRTAGCLIDDSGTDWLTPQAGGDFEACLVGWQAQPPPIRADGPT